MPLNEIISTMSDWNARNGDGKPIDIESLLELLERLETSFRDILLHFFTDSKMKLADKSIEVLKKGMLSKELKRFVQKSFQDLVTSKYYEPLKKFVSNYRPLKIFTTNYDVVIEHFCHT
jgi:hypothetical protein